MTQDVNKTKAQLITELQQARKRIAEIETVSECSQSQDDKFRLLTENSVTGIFIIQDAKMVYVNPSFARMLGYEQEEIIGKLTLKELVHPDDIQIAMQRLPERLDGKIEERNIAYKAVKKDGTLVYVEVYGVRTEFQGRPAVMGTLIDVTKHKLAEDALQESESKFKSITENAVDCIFIKDRNRRYTFVNKAMKDLLGLPENEILGKTPEEVFGQEQGRIIKEVDDRTFSGEPVNETRNLLIGENQRFFNTVQTPLTSAEGKVTSIMGIVRDVTEHMQTEEVLRDSEQRFRTLFEGLPQPIIVYDRHTTILMINPAGAENLDRSPDECLGKSLKELLPDVYDFAAKRFRDVINTGKQLLVEDRVELSTGVRWFWTILQPVCDENGKAYAVMNISYDITERKRVESQILTEKNFTDTALDAQMDTFFLFEPSTGKALRWNRVFREISGYTDEEIAAMPAPASYYSQEDVERAETFIQNVLKEGSGTIELELTCKDGRKVPTEYRVSIINDDQEEPKYIISIGRDITERKMAEEALRENEMLFSSLLQHSPIYVFFKDSNMRSLRLSENYEQILGMPVNEALGKTMDELFPSDLARKMVTDDRKILEKGEMVRVEEKLNDRDYETIKFPIFKDGKPDILAGFTVDITERKRTEEALLEASKFREYILAEAPVGITIYDAVSGQCLAGNKAIAELVGASEEQVLAQNFYTIESWKNSGLLEMAKKALKDNSKKELEVNVTTTFGKEIWFHCYFVPFLVGEKRYLLFTLNDFTEREQMEKQLRQSEKMRAVGQLAGGIAHDFNNQLAGIVGYADMLREELSNSPELSHYADNILLATKRASDLTSQLLAFARKGKYLSVSIDIHKIINEVVGILQRTISKRIVIKQHLDAQLAQTQGDLTQMQNAIMNIALNARDAMPDGGEMIITTSIAQLSEEYCKTNHYDIKPGNFVKICVTDNGTGMDKATQKRIFEPFFTTKKQGKGTGMGMASVYGTVKNHSGAINVYSEPGHGTTMNMYLPHISSDTASEKEPAIQAEPARGNAHVLLVDDEEFILDTGLMMLEKSGYKVSMCRNGREAIVCYKKNWKTIDLVIIDMVMPEMGGRETFVEMKKVNPQIRALLSSGYSINGEAQQILNEGVMGFIQKPYRRIELSEKVADILRRSKVEE